MNDKTAYPLCWPDNWPRTDRYKITYSPFGRLTRSGQHSMDKVRRALQVELDRLGATNAILSTNVGGDSEMFRRVQEAYQTFEKTGGQQ